MWFAKRIEDEKEFLACSIFVHKKTGVSGIFGVAEDGEKTNLEDGTYTFYQREDKND